MPKPLTKEIMVDAPNTDARERLRELLSEKSFRRGKVVLASGRESDFYIDCKQTLLCAEGHGLIGRLLLEMIRQHFSEVKAVGGPTLGADPIVSAISTFSSFDGEAIDAFIIRKEPKGHGTAAWIEGMGNLKAGQAVVIVEDVITTGGSTLRAVARAREAGLDVRGVIVLVDRCEGGRENIVKAGLRVESLFSRPDFIPEDA